MATTTTITRKTPTITTNHYRQLDFLRLFKLARELELVKRKRKMPTSYNDLSNPTKAATDARSACRRLLRTVLKHLFNDRFVVTSNWSNYFVTIPKEERTALTFFIKNMDRLRNSQQKSIREAVSSYHELSADIDGAIHPALPHQIRVRLSNISQRDERIRRQGSNGVYVARRQPPENFYRCALACIRYKKIWDQHMGIIMAAYKLVEEKPDIITAPATDSDAAAASNSDAAHVSQRASEIEANRTERLSSAQDNFDRVFQQYLQREEQE
jgi:hypothetical protein